MDFKASLLAVFSLCFLANARTSSVPGSLRAHRGRMAKSQKIPLRRLIHGPRMKLRDERDVRVNVAPEPPLETTIEPVSERATIPKVKRGFSPSEAILGMYEAFNNRNATAASAFLTEDCLYEDLLLGPATICKGKKAFESALRFHPAFVMGELDKYLPPSIKAPDFHLVVDSVAEGLDSVGVEWHVEVNRKPFPLGRGLTQARLCPRTGKICRVVDIAEAPWRVIGLIAAPLVQFLFRPYIVTQWPWLGQNNEAKIPKPVAVPVNPRIPKRHR